MIRGICLLTFVGNQYSSASFNKLALILGRKSIVRIFVMFFIDFIVHNNIDSKNRK